MIQLPAQARAIVGSLLADIRERPRYRGGFTIDESGESHAWGAVNCERYGSCAGTLDDVANLRRSLKKLGVNLTQADADALVSEAIWHDDGCGGWYTVTMTAAQRARIKRQRQAERRRAAGLCTSCGTACAPAKTCRDCNRKANERQKRARQRKVA
jgi:hypothetical protein